MTTRRAARRLVVAATVAVGAIAVLPAVALEQEPLTVPGRSVVEKDYPPIPASEPATVTAGVVGPDECRDLPSCALVPLDVEVPQLDPGDDFYLILEMGWEATDIADNNVYAVKSNDLDTYLYDDKQMTDGASYTRIGSSASADNPETIKAFEPKLGRYNLVVANFAGANTGWHVKAQSLVGEFDKPIESLSPAGGTNNPNNKPPPTTAPPSTPTTARSTTSVSVAEGTVFPDADFQGEAFAPDNSFQDQLAALAGADSVLRRPRPDVGSPSAVTVVAAMVGLPASLIAVVIVAVRLRKRAALL